MPAEQDTSFQLPKLASAIVWIGVTSCGKKTSLVFIDQGIKIYLKVYLDMLKNTAVFWVKNYGRLRDNTSARQSNLPYCQIS